MGMTINEAIKDLKETKQYLNILGVLHHPANKGMEEAMNIAMDTMCKYQKIQEIASMWEEDRKRFTLGDYGIKDEYLRQISEVLNGYINQ